MSSTSTSITLSEWETRGPDNCPELVDRYLDASSGTRHVAERLVECNLVGITELRRGLRSFRA